MTQDRVHYEQALNRGHSLSWDQHWQEAVKSFEAAAKVAPEEPAPYAGLGMAYLELEQLEKALLNYKKAARFSRGNIIYLRKVADVQERLQQLSEAGKTYMAIGEMELTRRRLSEAMDNWHRAVQLEPNLLRAHQRLASVYRHQGAVRNAVREYLAIAQILQAEDDREKALEACQHALQLDPRNKDILTSIEMIKQGEPLASQVGPVAIALGARGTTGLLQRIMKEGEGDGPDPEKNSRKTAIPVQDARRTAMARLADGLFTDEEEEEGEAAADMAKLQRDHLISQALDFQRRGMVNEAIDHYEQAIAAGEDSTAAHFNLGLLFQDKLRFDEAIAEFEISVQDQEFRLASHFALGECYRARGHIGEAVEHFITVLKIVDLATVRHDQADRLIQLYENLANSLMTQGEREQATDFANGLVEFLSLRGWEDKAKEARRRLDSISEAGMMILGDVLKAGSPHVLETLYLSQEYMRRRMFNTAIEESYRAIQLSPDYLPAHVQLAEVLAKQGRREVAALKFATVADTYRMRGDVNSATAVYEKAVGLVPLDLEARTRLIELFRQHGQIERALEHTLGLGEAHYQLAQVDKARDTYQGALKLVNRSSDEKKWKARILKLIADIDMARFDWRKALSAYLELRQLDPEDEATAITLVRLYYRVGQANNAVRELDRYLNQLVRSGRGLKVVAILEDMVNQRPADANLVERLSRLYLQQKRSQAAIDLLDRLGEAQLEAGDHQGAVRTIERIIQLKPTNVASYEQLVAQLRQQFS